MAARAVHVLVIFGPAAALIDLLLAVMPTERCSSKAGWRPANGQRPQTRVLSSQRADAGGNDHPRAFAS